MSKDIKNEKKRDINETENENEKEKEKENDEYMYDNTRKIDMNELSESYVNEMYYENVHECVVESLKIIKIHIKEKSLRMGQKIEYGDIFDFFF